MVGAVGMPIVDYELANQNRAPLLAQFQKTPSFSQSVAYYQANIGNVKTVDDLLNDRKLLTVALSAFQLEGSIDQKGLLRKLLSQDPTAQGSLAQQLIDPRFTAFAQAFSSLRSDGGAAVSAPNSVNAVLAGFQTNEFQKFISTQDNDPTVRQALFFQQTIQDTVDISDSGKLLQQFELSANVQQTVANFENNIGNVTSISGLVNDPKLLNVALTAFNIDPATVSVDTVQQVLTEGPTAKDPLLTSDPRFAQLANAFAPLSSGKPLSQSSISSIVTAYQTRLLGQTLAANDPTATTLAFGTGGSETIGTLLADFQQGSGVAQAVSFYQNNIGNVRSVDDLVNNPQLLNVALGAFNLDPTNVPPAVARQLLVGDQNAPSDVQTQANALLLNDPDAANFIKAFGSLTQAGGAQLPAIGNLFKQFGQQASVQQAVTHYQDTIGSVTTVAGLTGDAQLLGVALNAFNIDPATVSTSTVTQILTETPTQQAADPLLTSDPRFAQFAQVFGSLNTDGGTSLHTSAGITSIVTSYQTNLFAQTVSANDPTTTTADFGVTGASTVNALATAFQGNSGVSQATRFYENNIGTVTSVSDLVGNPQLLKVALGAFGIDSTTVAPSTITQILTETPAQQAADPILTSNAHFAQFVQAFGSLNTDNGVGINQPLAIDAITSGFTTNQLQQSVLGRVQEVIANPGLGTAPAASVTSTDSVATITSAFQANRFEQFVVSKAQQVTANPSTGTLATIQFLGNPTLSAVVLGSLGLPPEVGALDPTQQIAALTRAGFDPSKLLDPAFLNQFVDRFLIGAGQNAPGSSDPVLSLFGGGSSDDGSTPLDLSFLNNGSSINLLA